MSEKQPVQGFSAPTRTHACDCIRDCTRPSTHACVYIYKIVLPTASGNAWAWAETSVLADQTSDQPGWCSLRLANYCC